MTPRHPPCIYTLSLHFLAWVGQLAPNACDCSMQAQRPSQSDLVSSVALVSEAVSVVGLRMSKKAVMRHGRVCRVRRPAPLASQVIRLVGVELRLQQRCHAHLRGCACGMGEAGRYRWVVWVCGGHRHVEVPSRRLIHGALQDGTLDFGELAQAMRCWGVKRTHGP